MRLFARKKDTPEFNDDHYDPDEVFEKHYENFAASVRGEINIGSEDCKQVEYTMQDGKVYVLRTVAEYVVFAAPKEHIDLTWVLTFSSAISQLALPALGAMKDAATLIRDFTARYDGDEASKRSAEILSSYTFNTLRYLDAHFHEVQTIRSVFLLDDAENYETLQLEVLGKFPIDQIADAFEAVQDSESAMVRELGFENFEEFQEGEISVFDTENIQIQDPSDTSIDLVVRGVLSQRETITFHELSEKTQGLLWRDVLNSVYTLFAHDALDIRGGTAIQGLPDVDGIMSASQDALSLQEDAEVIQGEVIVGDVVNPDAEPMHFPEVSSLQENPFVLEESSDIVEGTLFQESMFDYDDDGGFDFEDLEDEYGFTTAALDDTLLTYDAQEVIRAAGVEGRVYDRLVRFLQENDRLERELTALETSISQTRDELKHQKAHFGDLVINRELYEVQSAAYLQDIQDTKDTVHQIYFTLASKEEDRERFNQARQEVLQEAHEIMDTIHADGVQDILNRIENKISAIAGSTNVAYQTDEEEAEAVLAETQNAVTHENVLGTPIFDRLARQRSIGL